jgi:8-amino-7-oxononanoate synthase
MLGSNNYLGLTGDERVVAAARAALDQYGAALTGSRLLNGTTPLHEELEREIADWMKTEDALVYTTGYQANVGALSTLLVPGDTVIVDSGDHASIMDGVAMSHARIRPFKHNRLKRLEELLERSAGDGGGVLVVVDGVYSMEGDVADLQTIVPLAKQYGARVMVDEAHGVGVLGEHGRGACEVLGVEDEVDLRMGTFSKSLASCGGFLVGSHEVIDFLRIQSRSFLFTASAVPAAIGSALAAVKICNSDEGPALFQKVLDNAKYLRDGLKDLGFRVVESEPVTAVVPVIIGDDWQAVMFWKALYDAGVYTNVALYPAVPRGGALIRTSVMATHEREHLDRALAVFDQVRDSAQASDPS